MEQYPLYKARRFFKWWLVYEKRSSWIFIPIGVVLDRHGWQKMAVIKMGQYIEKQNS